MPVAHTPALDKPLQKLPLYPVFQDVQKDVVLPDNQIGQ